MSSDRSTFVHGLKIAESTRAHKGKQKLPIIDEVDDQSDEDFVAGAAEKVLKKNYDATRKFQDSWAARLPWVELICGIDGLIEYLKCIVCSQITGKPKILCSKWDTLAKHGGKRKATQNMANGIKKGQ